MDETQAYEQYQRCKSQLNSVIADMLGCSEALSLDKFNVAEDIRDEIANVDKELEEEL